MKNKTTKWTRFMDMHSGGGLKEEPYSYIYIEAPEDEARVIFYNRFGHDPERITCDCCGEDYAISEEDNLEQATAFERGCRFVYIKNGKEISQNEGWVLGKGIKKGVWSGYIEEPSRSYYYSYQILEEYLKNKPVLVIRKNDIKPEEREK